MGKRKAMFGKNQPVSLISITFTVGMILLPLYLCIGSQGIGTGQIGVRLPGPILVGLSNLCDPYQTFSFYFCWQWNIYDGLCLNVFLHYRCGTYDWPFWNIGRHQERWALMIWWEFSWQDLQQMSSTIWIISQCSINRFTVNTQTTG